MWVWYSLLGLLLLIVAALSVPVFGRLSYDGELKASIRVLGIPFTLLPQPEKEKKKPGGRAAEPVPRSSKFKELLSLMKQDSLSGTLLFLREVAALATKTVGRLLRAVTITRMDLQLLVATGDAATTAQRYGQVCSVLYPALAGMEEVVRIRRRDLRVEPNFLLENSAVRFDVRLRMSVWRLLGAGIALLWGFLMIKEQNEPQN